MKKLLAGYCCILFLQSFSQFSTEFVSGSEKAAGQKYLIKAISAIINTEGNKKAPAKALNVFAAGSPEL
jgi:hypothetical protein